MYGIMSDMYMFGVLTSVKDQPSSFKCFCHLYGGGGCTSYNALYMLQRPVVCLLKIDKSK